MPRQVDLDGLRRLMDQGAQVVDVLPAREYGEDHIPGAIHLPLRKIETEAREVLAKMPKCDRWDVMPAGQTGPRENPFRVWPDLEVGHPAEPSRCAGQGGGGPRARGRHRLVKTFAPDKDGEGFVDSP